MILNFACRAAFGSRFPFGLRHFTYLHPLAPALWEVLLAVLSTHLKRPFGLRWTLALQWGGGSFGWSIVSTRQSSRKQHVRFVFVLYLHIYIYIYIYIYLLIYVCMYVFRCAHISARPCCVIIWIIFSTFKISFEYGKLGCIRTEKGPSGTVSTVYMELQLDSLALSFRFPSLAWGLRQFRSCEVHEPHKPYEP